MHFFTKNTNSTKHALTFSEVTACERVSILCPVCTPLSSLPHSRQTRDWQTSHNMFTRASWFKHLSSLGLGYLRGSTSLWSLNGDLFGCDTLRQASQYDALQWRHDFVAFLMRSPSHSWHGMSSGPISSSASTTGVTVGGRALVVERRWNCSMMCSRDMTRGRFWIPPLTKELSRQTGHRTKPCSKIRSAQGALQRMCEQGRMMGHVSSSRQTGHCSSRARSSFILDQCCIFNKQASLWCTTWQYQSVTKYIYN